jgi:hypothetical protein
LKSSKFPNLDKQIAQSEFCTEPIFQQEQMQEFHGPPTFPSYYNLKPKEKSVKRPLKENIQNVLKFVSTESISNSDDLEIIDIPDEKILLKDYLYHLDPFHQWVEYFCTLSDTTLTMYKSQTSWENGEQNIKSCFIMTSVLEYPEFNGISFVFSLFSHDKEGKSFLVSQQDVFSTEDEIIFQLWKSKLRHLINGQPEEFFEPKNHQE